MLSGVFGEEEEERDMGVWWEVEVDEKGFYNCFFFLFVFFCVIILEKLNK